MRPIGLGCMRLSTAADRDEARARATVAEALAAGVTLFDTADAYAHDDTEVGHNELLLAAAIGDHQASRERSVHLRDCVTVVTKGGLTRPDGAWVADGRARHLAAAARASRDRLGVPVIDLYLLHAIDPRTDLATSVRALARLREDGVVRAIGLSNVNLLQLEEALAIAPIDAVEVELGPTKLDAIRGGLVAACEVRGIRVLAHRPLGGQAGAKRLAKDPVLVAVAAHHDATPCEIALAWLASLSPAIVPIPGASRPETARSAARAMSIALSDEDRAAIEQRFVTVGTSPVRHRDSAAQTLHESVDTPGTQPRDSARTQGAEVVLIAGTPGAGKSTLAADYTARGYARLNRDERGGTLLDLARELDRMLADGIDRVVLDNTYPTRASRAPVIEVAHRHGATVRCVTLETSLEDAQTNAASRILAQHGRLLEPDELRARATALGPSALFRYRRAYEPPRADEGFDALDAVPFHRVPTGANHALIVELDQIVWVGRARVPTGVRLVEGARARLAAWGASGAVLAGTTWQPGGDLAALAALAARLVELLEFSLPIVACFHLPGPPVCWCRKPLPGLGLVLARDHDLALARSVHLGRGPTDRGFATRLGMRYVDLADGWPSPAHLTP